MNKLFRDIPYVFLYKLSGAFTCDFILFISFCHSGVRELDELTVKCLSLLDVFLNDIVGSILCREITIFLVHFT